MRMFFLVVALLCGCVHADRRFAQQFHEVGAGAQLTGRAGPYVIARANPEALQVTSVTTPEERLQTTLDEQSAERLAFDVQSRIANDPRLRHEAIQVNAGGNGVVTLVGHVRSTEKAARAVLLAMRVPGVNIVNTDLRR
jgi:osmotically-inducible protein OsmY